MTLPRIITAYLVRMAADDRRTIYKALTEAGLVIEGSGKDFSYEVRRGGWYTGEGVFLGQNVSQAGQALKIYKGA